MTFDLHGKKREMSQAVKTQKWSIIYSLGGAAAIGAVLVGILEIAITL